MKHKLYPFLALLVLLSMVLAACSPAAATEAPAAEEPAAEEPAAEEPAEPVTLTLWHSLKDTETAGLTEIISAYTAEHPNVTIELLFSPFDDLRNKFETAAATGEGPDLLIGADDWGPAMYDAQLVADLSDVPTDGVNEAALSVGQYNGAQVMLPYVLKGVVLYRNTALQPEPVSSWDEMLALGQAGTSDDTTVALLEVGSFFSYGHLYAQGGALMNADGTPAFNTPEGVAWLNMQKDFVALGAEAWYTDNDVILFKEGKVGWIIDGTWNLGDLSASLGDDLAIDPWPAGMSGFVQTGAVFLSYNAEGAKAEAGKDFIAYLLTEDAQTAFYNADGAFIPSNVNVAVDDPLREQALEAFNGGIGWIVAPAMGAYWGPMETAQRSVISDGADPATALATAEEAVNTALAAQ
jgi:arabinogalactan oligomer/maltooligosaccharide transport system substrate-binding protein